MKRLILFILITFSINALAEVTVRLLEQDDRGPGLYGGITVRYEIGEHVTKKTLDTYSKQVRKQLGPKYKKVILFYRLPGMESAWAASHYNENNHPKFDLGEPEIFGFTKAEYEVISQPEKLDDVLGEWIYERGKMKIVLYKKDNEIFIRDVYSSWFWDEYTQVTKVWNGRRIKSKGNILKEVCVPDPKWPGEEECDYIDELRKEPPDTDSLGTKNHGEYMILLDDNTLEFWGVNGRFRTLKPLNNLT